MTDRMPALFIGHGNPMNALEHNRYTDAWRDLGASMATPRAIVSVSAHWYVNVTAVTAMTTPRTIHDFYGFPPALFDVDYPAPGAPAVAARVADLLAPHFVGEDEDSWGIDHGTWSVLVHMFPEADVPVIQLSIHAEQSFDQHFALGARLSALRDEGVLIIGSGNVVHNLRLINWQLANEGEAWAHRFDDAVREIVTSDPAALGSTLDRSEYDLAAPTPDHFLPLAYIAGLAAASSQTLRTVIDGYDLGSLSMTAYEVPA